MRGLLGFYLLVFAAAGLAGPEYAVAGLLADLILLTALCLLIAPARSKTAKRGPPPRRVSAPRGRSVCSRRLGAQTHAGGAGGPPRRRAGRPLGEPFTGVATGDDHRRESVSGGGIVSRSRRRVVKGSTTALDA
jgi:hypothetical protein